MQTYSHRIFLLVAVLLLLSSLSAVADFTRQPDTWSSSLSTNTGPDIYDWQLANMISAWIVPNGYANMIFVFDECYGGGMIDDLQRKLQGTGDVALMSAARHNEWSWFLNQAMINANTDHWSRLGFDRPTQFFGKEVAEEMARIGPAARTMEQIARDAAAADAVRVGGRRPNGNAWGDYAPGKAIVEHPQWLALGNGGQIKLGLKNDGQPAASKHAILFAGKADKISHWNDIDHIHGILTAYHGFPESNIHVLIGGGSGTTRPGGSAAPAYVDGPGTRSALWEAIRTVGRAMNPNEQFVFWASNHGNRDLTLRALDRAIATPDRTEIPARPAAAPGPTAGTATWDLDQAFLDTIRAVPDNTPTVSLIAVGLALDTCGNDLVLHLNGRELPCGGADEIVAWDDDPDIDGVELLFPVHDERILGLHNRVEIEWIGDPSAFTEYTILGLQIGTGAIDAAPDPLELSPESFVPIPPSALAVTVGTGLFLPVAAIELWGRMDLNLPPFRLRSRTDLRILPQLSLLESLEAGLVWDWVSFIANLDLSLAPWSLVSTGGWFEISPPPWTVLDALVITLETGTGWGPQWSPGIGFSHTTSGFLHGEAVWRFPGPWGSDASLSAGTAFETAFHMPGAFLVTDWTFSAEAKTGLSHLVDRGPTLRGGAATFLRILPIFDASLELRVDLLSNGFQAHGAVVLGIHGVRLEAGAEATWSWDL